MPKAAEELISYRGIPLGLPERDYYTREFAIVEIAYMNAQEDSEGLSSQPVAAEVALRFENGRKEEWFLIDRITIESNSTGTPRCRVYVGQGTREAFSTQNLRDITDNATANAADYAAPIKVPPGQTLWIRWTGLSGGARCGVSIEGRIAREVLRIIQSIGMAEPSEILEAK